MPEAINDIITPRLILRLLGEEVNSACLNNDFETAQHLLHATIPEEFIGELNVLQRDSRLLQENPEYKPWASRGIILKSEMKMIGLIRFHSSPCYNTDKPYMEGAVELGYRILPNYRRKGYARESVFGIINWAEEVFSVRRFIASISPENLPSLALTQSFGFIKVDEVMDETDGLEYVYMLERTSAE